MPELGFTWRIALRICLAASLVWLAMPVIAQAQTSSPLDGCLTRKYEAHRNIARDFWRKRTAQIVAELPEAKALAEADRDVQLALNDRLEIAFRHFLAKDRKALSLNGSANTWLALSDTQRDALVASLPEFKAANDRLLAAEAAKKAAGPNPKVRAFLTDAMKNKASPLSAMMTETTAAFARNDAIKCP